MTKEEIHNLSDDELISEALKGSFGVITMDSVNNYLKKNINKDVYIEKLRESAENDKRILLGFNRADIIVNSKKEEEEKLKNYNPYFIKIY